MFVEHTVHVFDPVVLDPDIGIQFYEVRSGRELMDIHCTEQLMILIAIGVVPRLMQNILVRRQMFELRAGHEARG